MTERKPEPHGDRTFAVGEQLAGGVVDCGDVHREIDQAGLDFAVAVMADVDQGHATAVIRPRRFQNTRAPTHVIAKIAAMP